MTYLKPVKDPKRSLNKQTSQEEQRVRISKSHLNTNNIYGSSLNKLKIYDLNQDILNKDNVTPKIKKVENKFDHRGRFLSKRDHQNTNQKFQSYSLKQSNSIQQISQMAQNEKKMNDKQRMNTPQFKINNFQIQLQKTSSSNQQVDENIMLNLRANKVYSSEISESSIINKDDSNSNRQNHFQKESIFKNQAYSIIDNTNNLETYYGKKSPALQKTKSESKYHSNMYQKKTFNEYISPKKSSNFMNNGQKSQTNVSNINSKSIQTQNTQILKDKLSDSEQIDDFSLPIKDHAKILTKNLSKNQNYNYNSPYLTKSQTNEENIFKSDKLNKSVENAKQQNNPQIQKILKLSHQLTVENNSSSNQQQSNQTQNEEIQNYLSSVSGDKQNIFDYAIQNIYESNSKDILDELETKIENKDQLNYLNEQINSTDQQSKDQGLVIKSTQQEINNQQMQTKLITNISQITENTKVKELEQMIENVKYSCNQNQIETSEILQIQNDEVIKQNDEQLINQQTLDNIEDQNILQHTPLQTRNDFQSQNSIYVIPVQPLEENNIVNQEVLQSNQQIYFQPEFQNLDQIINTNLKNKSDSTILLEQQGITESENQQSQKENYDLSQLNSINQTTQKSFANINSNSYFYGSESTNETISSKRYNLTSLQLSNSFGKKNKNVKDQKVQLSSQDQKQNSEQQNSNNIIEFALDSMKNSPNLEEDAEKPEMIKCLPKPFVANIQITPSKQQIQKSIILRNDQPQNLICQQSSLVDYQFDSFVNIELKKNLKSLQHQQFDHNSYDKLKNNNDKQNNIIFSNDEQNDNNESGKSSSYKLIYQKKDKLHRFNHCNNDVPPKNFEQNILKKVQSVPNKSQDTLNKNKKNQILNQECGISNKSQQTQFLPHNKQDELQKQKIVNIQKIIDKMQFQQCEAFQSQIEKEININKKNTIPSIQLDVENALFKNISIKNTNHNDLISQREILTQNEQLIIAPENDRNIIKQQNLEDFSPRKNIIYDYKIFWDHFQKQEDKPRKFTFKQICYALWPQKLDRKQRESKELILKLYQTDYNSDDNVHKNLINAISLHYNQLLHGNIGQPVEDKQFSRNRHQRNTVHVLPNKPAQENTNKQIQSLSNLFNHSNNNLELKLFTLIHILAFLNISKDILDQSFRRLFKKIQLFYLLLRISNVVLQKFQQNLFDKCIKILNKDVMEFLNEIFFQIFYETINSIILLEKFETTQMTIKLYDKVDQINKQLNSTDQIIKFLQDNNNNQNQQSQQTQWNIVY